MEVKEFVQRQLAAMRRQCDAALQDMTDEQFNWMPPGTVNPIRTTLVHMIAAEDSFVQRVILDKPTVWDSGNWSEQIGLPFPPGRGRWDEVRDTTLASAPVLAYAQAVRVATDAYVAELTASELDRAIQFMGATRSVADALTILVTHTVGHAGEISAVRGMQGVKGLPF